MELYKELLMQRMETLIGTAGKTLDELVNEDETFSDPLDRASSESNRSIELRKRDRERKLIQKIKKALVKIQEGTYGECTDCSDEISSERLRARPEATLCIKCKEDQEQLEKRFGK